MKSRLDKTLLNAKANFVFNIMSFVLAFFSRRIFLERLGADFLGLSSTIGNLLGFLNLAELGVGAAIGYVLYKPLADNDQESLNKIISVMGYFYKRIGCVIAVCGIVLSGFLHLIYAKSAIPLQVIYFGYYTYFTSSLIGYFWNYRMVLLNADQRGYVVTAYFKTCNIIQLISQMCFAYFIANQYVFFSVILITSIVHSFILNWKINLTYPKLFTNVKEGRNYLKDYPKISVYIRQIFIHRITGFASSQITPLLIYAFVSLESVATYGNYESVISKFSLVSYALFSSVFASVGNLIASSTREKSLAVMKELFAISFFFTGLSLFGMFMMMDDFIALWIGQKYILGNSVLILFLVHFFISQQGGIVEMFINGFGLFSDIYAPAVESLLFLPVAIIGGYYWGQAGVILGSVFSRCIIWQFWKPYYLFKRGFKMSMWEYWRFWLRHLCVQALVFCLAMYAFQMLRPFLQSGIFSFLISCIICTVIFCSISLPIMYFTTEGTRAVLKRMYFRWETH